MEKNTNDKNSYIPMPCGGKGTCGKCKIKITSGTILPNERDKKFLTEDEINSGFRIACGHTIPKNVTFITQTEDFKTVSNYINKTSSQNSKNTNSCAIIIDVGTTTLCFQLIDENGNEIKTTSRPNSQRAFGADVLSRISKACAGGLSHLSNMLKNDLKQGIFSLLEGIKTLPKEIYIAGNTTMTYFLRNMDCRGLGVYPFENNATETFKQNSITFFDNTFPFSCNVTILPCIQTFVGGDIVAGAYFLNMDKEENSIFIDIGTNGEIMLNSKGKLFAASVAAGPAFEGGNISCGAGGIAGAINKISIKNNSITYETIGNIAPIGICGSALIDLIAELLKNNIIDSTGLLKDEYFSNGIKVAENIFLKQNDIRQLQLAKSAIISGIQCLLNYAKTKPSEIKNVFVGGGFGFFLNTENALKIKLFPEEFDKKIILCGNTVLGGLSKIYSKNSTEYEKFISLTEHINLAEKEEFQNLFIENLNF